MDTSRIPLRPCLRGSVQCLRLFLVGMCVLSVPVPRSFRLGLAPVLLVVLLLIPYS